MLVVKTNINSRYEMTLLNNLHNTDNDFRIKDSTPLFFNIFGKIFYFVNKIFD